MDINKNAEGYPDPTAYTAITNIQREETQKYPYMPVVFICSPYAGNIAENSARASRYCRHAVDNGYIPMAPHLLYPQFLNDSDAEERSLGLFMGLVWLTKCSELWVFGSRISPGMELEIRKARTRSMFIRYFTKNCEEVTPI